jgi:hypothetical protein
MNESEHGIFLQPLIAEKEQKNIVCRAQATLDHLSIKPFKLYKKYK